MHYELNELGVPPEVQRFFNLEEPIFDFGDQREHFSAIFHRVPASQNLWTAGDFLARHVVITFSAMEAIAFLAINQGRFPIFHDLFFIATGSKISVGQLNWVRQNLKGRKIILAFGNDLLGRLTDIKVAMALRNLPITLHIEKSHVFASLKEKTFIFNEEEISLNAFEKAVGIRTKIRTSKPTYQLTFLNQLKHEPR